MIHMTNHLLEWCGLNSMQIAQEILTYFGKSLSTNTVASLEFNGELIKRVQSFKLLGVILAQIYYGDNIFRTC